MKKWYRCQDISPDYVATVDQGSLDFAPVVALQRTTLAVPEVSNYLTERDAHLGPAFGVGVRYTFPGGLKRFSAKADATYHDAGTVVDRQRNDGNAVTALRIREQTRKTVRADLLAEYRLVRGQLPFYVAGGLEYGWVLDTKLTSDLLMIDADGRESSVLQDLDEEEYLTNEIGPVIEAGTYLGALQISVRASQTIQILATDNFRNRRLGLVIVYWF